MIENIIFTTNTVAPVFLMVALGYLLKWMNIINENFVQVISKFVFSVSLPAFIFIEISELDLSKAVELGQIGFIYTGTLLMFVLSWVVSIPYIKDPRDRSAFIQGAFRGNYAIVGLALISSLFGKSGLGKATILLAFVLPLYNVLAVVALTVPMRKIKKLNIKGTFNEILFNPLILAVIVALPFSIYKVDLHPVISKSINYLSDVALPLALIGIGVSLNIDEIKRASSIAISSSAIKIVFAPLVLTPLAYFFGYRAVDLGIMFILFACPTAIVSFIMAEAMGANGKLAGNIILITTLASVVTIAFGILVMKSIGVI